MKVGDRVLGVNGIDVTRSSLKEAVNIVRHSLRTLTLLVEYDVSVMGTLFLYHLVVI